MPFCASISILYSTSPDRSSTACSNAAGGGSSTSPPSTARRGSSARPTIPPQKPVRSEEHTSELQSHVNLVCRLLLEKKGNASHGGDSTAPLPRPLPDDPGGLRP